MLWKLYLDDMRPVEFARDLYIYCDDDEKFNAPWHQAHNFGEAVALVETLGLPIQIDFDHDLGDGPTGFDFAKWLVEYDQEHDVITQDNFNWTVHSVNPEGANNIDALLKSYLKVKFAFSELIELVCKYCDEKATCRVCRLHQFIRMLEFIFLKKMTPKKAAKMANDENLYCSKQDEAGDEERYRIAV